MNLRGLTSLIPITAAAAAGWVGATLMQGSPAALAQTPTQSGPPANDGPPVMPMGGVTEWNYPESIEAVHAAPKNHYVLYEDDHIRMVQVIIQPGETENLHGHKYPSVFFRDTVRPAQYDSAPSKNGGAEIRHEQPRLGEDGVYPSAFAMPTPQGPHHATITDTFPDMFYRVEFKKVLGKSIESMTRYPYPKVKKK